MKIVNSDPLREKREQQELEKWKREEKAQIEQRVRAELEKEYRDQQAKSKQKEQEQQIFLAKQQTELQ